MLRHSGSFVMKRLLRFARNDGGGSHASVVARAKPEAIFSRLRNGEHAVEGNAREVLH